MDGVSTAASLIGIGTVGCQIAIKLYTLATQISTASQRVTSISNDVSLTSGVLQELGEFMTSEAAKNGTTIFSKSGLENTKHSAAMCESIFREIDQAARDASEQLRMRDKIIGKIKLSKSEKAKWPFLQPSIENLRIDLREAKGTLMLMLQFMNLAVSQKMSAIHQTASTNIIEQREIYRAILAIHKQTQGSGSSNIKRLSVDRSHNDAARPASQRKMGEKSPSVEKSTLVQSPPTTSASSPPIRPTNFMAIPEPNMPDTRSSQEPKKEPIPEKASSGCVDCTGNTQHDGANSISDQSLQGGNTTLRDDSNTKNQHEEPEELDLWFIKPYIRDYFGEGDGVLLTWIVYKLQMPQVDIQKLLDKEQQESLRPLVEVYQDLAAHENECIRKSIEDAGFGASLLSLKRTHTDMSHRGILFKAVPGLQFAVMSKKSQKVKEDRISRARYGEMLMAQGYSEESTEFMDKDAVEKQKKGYHAHSPHSPHAMGRHVPEIVRMSDQMKVMDLKRPTHIRVHRKYLSWETLDAYDLPWAWDEDDATYIVIKRWVNEADRDKLFDHTHRLREQRLLANKTAEPRKEKRHVGNTVSPKIMPHHELPATSGGPLQLAGYSGSGHGATSGRDAAPRHYHHRHPARSSDSTGEEEDTKRTIPSRTVSCDSAVERSLVEVIEEHSPTRRSSGLRGAEDDTNKCSEALLHAMNKIENIRQAIEDEARAAATLAKAKEEADKKIADDIAAAAAAAAAAATEEAEKKAADKAAEDAAKAKAAALHFEEKKEPIRLKDAVGRQYGLPFQL
ncbi:MAG: hypothetical protein Q9181_007192, partial [Wetmoreana brouardii]